MKDYLVACSRLTLGKRFALGFAVLLAFLLTVAGTGQVLITVISRQMQGIVEVNNRKIALASSLNDEVSEVALSLRTMILLTDVREVDSQMLVLEQAASRALALEKALGAAFESGTSSPGEIELLKDIRKVGAATMPLVRRAARMGADGATPEAGTLLMKEIRPVEQRWRKLIFNLIDLERQLNDRAYEQAKSTRSAATMMLVGVSAAATLAGALLAWALTRSVLVPVAEAINVAERVSEGDLTTVIATSRSDELGRLLGAVSTMQQRLRALVGEILHSTESISMATSEIAEGNNDLSRRTEGQAASLQKTVSSMKQLTGAVHCNAESVRRADRLADEAARTAARGGEVIADVRNMMSEISVNSRRIGDIIGVIDSIAFRTNILALNAAVEASRAGEYGRGFAVVASEVRNLAKGSADAAKEVRTLVKTSHSCVAAGEKLVGSASTTMKEIVDSIGHVTVIMSEIAASTTEQSTGIAHVGGEVARLDDMTQQNAALVEQSAAATESLRNQASRLTDSVGVFRIEGESTVPA